MSHIFISYARKDMDFVRRIVTALEANNFDVWIDLDDLPKAEDWEKEIYRNIDEAEAFLFMISPDSVVSQMCNKELIHAVKNNKRILPIVIFDSEPHTTHPEISKRNWIFCRDGQDDFNKALEETSNTIRTDFEWLRFHTELQVKALKWEPKKDNSLLLRGNELRQAADELVKAGVQKDPQPTELQRNYVLAGQRNEIRQRRQTTTRLAFVLAIVAMLAVLAWSERNSALNSEANAIAQANAKATALVNEERARATAQSEKERAEEQSRIARSGELAAAAVSNLDTDPERSILLAMQAIKVIDAQGEALPEAVDALQRALHTSRVQLTIPIYVDQGTENWVNDVTFSPDGNLIAVGRTDGQAQIWDVSSGTEAKLIHEFPRHGGWVHSVAFSPNGKFLATASGQDHTVRVWDIATEEIWRTFSEHTDVVYSVVFSPDGTRLATASWDGTTKVWDLAQAQTIVTLPMNARAMDVVFSPDGNLVAVAGDNGIARIWNANSGAELEVFSGEGGHTAGINSILFSQDPNDGRNDGRLITASDDKTVIVWDADSGSPLDVITGHAESVRSVTLISKGLYLVTGSIDGTVKMWDLNTAKNLLTFVGHSNSVDSVAYDPVHTRLASASRDGTIKIWNAAIGHTSSVNSVVFSPDGTQFATASDDKTARLWSSDSGLEIRQFVHERRVTDVVFNPDGSRLATASDEMPIKIWDAQTGKPLLAIDQYSDFATVLAFSPDGRLLAAAGNKQIIQIWDADTGGLLYELQGHTDRITSVTFTRDGSHLISSSLDKTTREWEVRSEKEISNYDNGLMRDASISPNGKWVVTANDEGQVKLWRDSNKLPADLIDHDNKVYDVAFDTNGTSLATGSWDKTSKLLFFGDGDITAGKVRWIFHNTAEVYRVAFSPDGRLLAMAMVDGQVNIYLLNVSELLEYGRTRVSRSFTPEECALYFAQEECPSRP